MGNAGTSRGQSANGYVKTVIEFTVLVLGITRLTEILNYEKIAVPIREYFGILHNHNGEKVALDPKEGVVGFFGEVLNCFNCTSVWVSILFTIGYHLFPKTTLFFAKVLGGSWLAIRINQTLDP